MVPDLSGYQDWDHIVAGMLIPIIYQGEMNEDRRACVASLEVMVPPRARSSCSGEGSPVTALDQSLGPDDEVPSPGAVCHQVIKDSQEVRC